MSCAARARPARAAVAVPRFLVLSDTTTWGRVDRQRWGLSATGDEVLINDPHL